MILEIFGVLFGCFYLALEIMQKKGMWVVGLLMAAVYAVVFFQQAVYASMGFQIYYIVVSIYGFLQWRKDKQQVGEIASIQTQTESQQNKICYRTLPVRVFLWSAVIYAAATAFMVLVLGRLTDDPMPWADSSITVLSAIATFWLSKSYKEQWLIWLAVNLLTVTMALRLQMYPTAILYTINSAASLYGYIHWLKKGTRIA